METMDYSIADSVAHLRFTRPEGANAVNPAFVKILNLLFRKFLKIIVSKLWSLQLKGRSSVREGT